MSEKSDVQKQSILIIDDTPANLDLLNNYLETYGVTVLTARSGEQGIKKAQYALPDLILLDIVMPGIDGFETCCRLKADEATKHIPVIFMTALETVEHKVRGFEVGAADYITKPFQISSSELAQRMDVAASTISIYVRRLRQKGLVSMARDERDRRTWWLQLTEAGQLTYQDVITGTIRYTRDFISMLNNEEQRTLHRLLLQISHALGFTWQ
jgi:CheY-like chemotaxis protein